MKTFELSTTICCYIGYLIRIVNANGPMAFEHAYFNREYFRSHSILGK